MGAEDDLLMPDGTGPDAKHLGTKRPCTVRRWALHKLQTVHVRRPCSVETCSTSFVLTMRHLAMWSLRWMISPLRVGVCLHEFAQDKGHWHGFHSHGAFCFLFIELVCASVEHLLE